MQFGRPVWHYLLVCFALMAGGCDQKQDVKTLRLGHSLESGHPVHLGMVQMAEKLFEYSSGTMRIDIYPSNQLGTERELVELLQVGSLAMTKVSTSLLESFVPEMKVFSLPYVFRDHDHYWRVLESDIGKRLLLAPTKVRLRGLAYYDAGSRSFYTTDRAIVTPADLRGLKIRVMKSQTSVEMVTALGGAATPISYGELYTALQQGVVDGAENNPPSFRMSRHYEHSKYYVLDEHTSVPDILLISDPVWQFLSPEQQGWLTKAVRDSVKYQRALWQTATEEALETVKAAGVEVIIPDKAPFVAAVAGMKAAYKGTALGDLLIEIEGM